MENKIISIIIVIIIIIVGALIYKYSISGNVIKNDEIKIGVISPLTGDLAIYAEGANNAILMAVEDSGLRNKINLIIEDDRGCVTSDAITAGQKLVNIDNVDGIIGPLCSSPLLALAPLTEQQKTVMISPSATSDSITGTGNYIFRTIASDKDKSIAIADFAYKSRYKKAAILYSLSDATVQQKNEVKERFTELGGEIIAEESFNMDDKDFRSQLIKIKNSGSEIVFLSALQIHAPLILKQANELNLKVRFLGTDTSLGSSITTLDPSLSENFVYPFAKTPDNKEYEEFIEAYKSRFGKEPSAYAAEAYDAAILLIKAIDKSDSKEEIKANLYNLGQNYHGASGVITFDENGDVSKPISIMVIKNGEAVELK